MYVRKDVLELFRLIDWMLGLPGQLENEFRQELINFECENDMPYVTSIERFGREEGRQETLREDIVDILEVRFGTIDDTLRSRIQALDDAVKLKALLRRAAVIQSLADFSTE